MLKRFFDFFLFTSLFIAGCAVLMAYQTALLFGLQVPLAFYGYVLAGTVCSYNFHWYLTPPQIDYPSPKLKWSLSNKTIHLWLAVAGLAAAGICALLLIKYWFYLGLSAVITFLYSAPMINHPLAARLRTIAVGKTIFLAAAWVVVTALLPLLIAGQLSAVELVFTINRFFFLYAICIAFDRRDVETDRKAGIKSLVTYLSLKGVDRLFWLSLALALITSFWFLKQFGTLEVFCLMIPMVLMGFLYNRSKQTRADYFYYFLLDGLMALSAPLLILAKFAR